MAAQVATHRAGAGPPVVFLHGWTMSGDIFAETFGRLSDRFTCLAPDLPGHGATRGGEVSVAGAVEALREVLEEADLREVTLVGWSLGALVAWRYIQEHGAGRIARMVSVDMSPRPLNGEGWALGLRRQDAAAARAKTAWFRDHWETGAATIAATMFADPAGAPGLSVEAARARIAANDGATMARMWASLIEQDCRTAVKELPVSLLVMHGAHSRVYPAETAHWLSASAPRARRLCFARSGHAPNLEEPDTFAEAVAAFAAEPVAG